MAQASVELIDALRQTARQLKSQTKPNAESSGCRICNQLIQLLINRPAAKLKSYFRKNTWHHLLASNQAESGNLLLQLQELGLSQTDLRHLENLSDPEVLGCLHKKNQSNHSDPEQFAVHYLLAWATLLEKQLLATLGLPVEIGAQRMAA